MNLLVTQHTQKETKSIAFFLASYIWLTKILSSVSNNPGNKKPWSYLVVRFIKGLNPLSANHIHIQIHQTDLHAFP